SPLGFEELRAYEQAYPGVPGSAAVVRASTGRYWVFRGIAYRGSVAQGAVWNSLGPLSMGDGGASGTGNFSGRVAALAISPACEVEGPCRMWVGAAGGGVWRSDDAMNTADPGWRWIRHGLAHQQHRQPDRRSQRRERQHDLCRHRRNELAAELGRRHRRLSLDRRWRWVV